MESEFDKEEGDETRAVVRRKQRVGKEEITILDRLRGKEITAGDKMATKNCSARQNRQEKK